MQYASPDSAVGAIAGYAVMIVTGVLLFLSEPVKCYGNTSFRYKLLFVLLAGVQRACLPFNTGVPANERVGTRRNPAPRRKAGGTEVISLISWGIVIIAGRTTAYHFLNLCGQILKPFFQWSENLWIGHAIADTTWAFPVIETIHILGLTVMFRGHDPYRFCGSSVWGCGRDLYPR